MAELTIMLRKTLGGLTGVDVVHVFLHLLLTIHPIIKKKFVNLRP